MYLNSSNRRSVAASPIFFISTLLLPMISFAFRTPALETVAGRPPFLLHHIQSQSWPFCNGRYSSSLLNSFPNSGGRRSRIIGFAANQNLGYTNQDLVEKRHAIAIAKRAARQRTIDEQVEKNLRLKRLLHTEQSSSIEDWSSSAHPVYAAKVWVANDLREELRLTGREKRGRLFLDRSSDGVSTMKGLRSEIHGFFRALKKDSYLLVARPPIIAADGTFSSPEDQNMTVTDDSWSIETDEDVVKTFQAAEEFFRDESNNLKRPSIQLCVLKNPNAPPPPPPPPYLEGMADPKESETMTMISFYAFPPSGIDDPEAFAFDLKKKWKPFDALGRVYVAKEGVNAQMSIPTNVLENFMDCCRSVPELYHMENDINVDPTPLTAEEFATAGVPVNGEPAPPFRNLHVRVRAQIVADGLDKTLDWQSAGYDMPPLEWHKKIKEAKEARANKTDEKEDANLPILLDCRNTYETDVGIFDGAEPLDTQNFRDSWDVLKERLVDTPKDAPIMTYCTGGIRCVKVGAYLTQELGFSNVSRLAGGIIAYDRALSETGEDEEPLFKGTNFVFDGRMGRAITEDALGTCTTCGSETSLVSNCLNDNCHKRMVQCENCRTSFHGTCSEACKQRIVNGNMIPRRAVAANNVEASDETKSASYKTIDDYSIGHSSPTPSLYKEMELNTQSYIPSGSHMVSGSAQGRWLSQLASMTREGRILELGTFTGYATTCLLEGARNAGKAIGSVNGNANEGPYVMTMERDARAFNLAVAHLKAVSEHGIGESGAEAVCDLRNNNNVEDIEDDVVSVSLDGIAQCDLHRVSDALAIVEEISAGRGKLNPKPFDMVFIDADKTRLLDYVEACLSSDRVLKPGGLIVVDNVLWKGLVLEASSGEFTSVADTPTTGTDELRKNRRARKLATKMHRFNSAIVQDDRVEVLMLPIRDGLSAIRKR